MKKFYVLSIILVTAMCGWSQTTYYWQSASGGNWTTAANWSTTPTGVGGTARNTPAINDILIVDKGTSMTINSIPSQTIGRLSILSGTVTLSASGGAQTLTISNGSGNDFIISSGATLSHDATLENVILAASATADISGTYQIGAIYNISAGSTITTVTGAIDNRSTITGASAAKLIFNVALICMAKMEEVYQPQPGTQAQFWNFPV